MPASIEYYGNLRIYVKLRSPRKSIHCNRRHGRGSARRHNSHRERLPVDQLNGLYATADVACTV